jgi:hypothetical protein
MACINKVSVHVDIMIGKLPTLKVDLETHKIR